MALRKFKDALHYADASVSLDPHKPHYYLLKVSLLLHFEDFNGAERAIAQAEKRCVNTKILNDAKTLLCYLKVMTVKLVVVVERKIASHGIVSATATGRGTR